MPKFRISTLLWLTLAVACFFAGMSWDDFYERVRVRRAKINPVTVAVGGTTPIAVPSGLPIETVAVVGDSVRADASNTGLQLSGVREGTAGIAVTDSAGTKTQYWVTVKPPQRSLVSVGTE